jgi:type I restriction enzyme S subunit
MMTTGAQKLPNGWQWVEIKDVADIIVPTRDKPKRFCGDIPWITLPDLDDFFVSSAKNLLTHEDAAEVGNRLMPPNTVLLSCAGSLGKVAVTTREVYANQQFYGLVAKANLIDPIFLAFSLKMLGEDFFFQMAGISTVGFFSKDKALGIKIVLPPLAEQKRIAAIAQKADRLRRTRRYALQLSDTYLRSVFLEMFGDYLHSGEVCELDDVITASPSNGLYKSEEFLGSGALFLDIKCLYRGFSVEFSEPRRVQITEKEKKKYEVFPGDILINRVSKKPEGVGKAVLVIDVKEPTVYESNIMRFRVNPSKVQPWFLIYYLASEVSRRELLSKANISNQASINQETLKSLKLPLPPLALQEKFAQIVQKFERLRTQQREGDRQAEHLFQTLLHRAFRGELTPQDANDEPASVLLEQIGAEQAKAEGEAKATTQAMGDAAEYLGMEAKEQDTEPIQLTLPGIE